MENDDDGATTARHLTGKPFVGRCRNGRYRQQAGFCSLFTAQRNGNRFVGCWLAQVTHYGILDLTMLGMWLATLHHVVTSFGATSRSHCSLTHHFSFGHLLTLCGGGRQSDGAGSSIFSFCFFIVILSSFTTTMIHKYGGGYEHDGYENDDNPIQCYDVNECIPLMKYDRIERDMVMISTIRRICSITSCL